MRFDFLLHFTVLLLAAGYVAFAHIALQGRPLNESLAYDALVREIGESLTAGRERIRLAPVTMLQRPDEVMFTGEGSLSSSRQQRVVAIPLIEKLKFRYIVIVTRHCNEWDANCYQANELELSAEKNALPLI
jgi:hypothetical protein